MTEIMDVLFYEVIQQHALIFRSLKVKTHLLILGRSHSIRDKNLISNMQVLHAGLANTLNSDLSISRKAVLQESK